MDALEKALIEKSLKEHQGSAAAVIAALGIGKKTFYDKLRRHGIAIGEFR
jgi:DNA-binding NtrC family response regulator